MKKIRSEFLTETEANSAMDIIKPYCGNIRIISSYDENYDLDYIADGGYSGFPEMNYFGLGGFGMISSWNFGLHNSPYNLYGMTERYKQAYPYSKFGYDPSRRATLEADVADDNYEYVKNKLYSNGAVSVS